jgi:ABC-2 type transport system permease protein
MISRKVSLDYFAVKRMRNFFLIILAFLRRYLMEMLSYRLQFALSLVRISFFLVVFFFIADLITGIGSPYLEKYGGEYFPFIVIGLALNAAIGAGLYGFTGAISGEQAIGTLEPMLTTPAGPFTIFLASTVASNVTSVIWPLIYLAAGAVIIGGFNWAGLPVFVLAGALTAVAYSGIGMISAAFTLVVKRGNPITLFFGTLPTLISGVYFPVEVLPSWLRAVGRAIPLTHGLELSRTVLLPGAAPEPLASGFLFLAIFAAVSIPVGYISFSYALNRARRDGSLSHY